MRLRSALLALALLAPVVVGLASERPADAASSSGIGVYVYSPAASTVRVRVSEGGDCDKTADSTLYDGPILAGEVIRIPITTWCVCASSTSVADPEGEYSPWMRYCGEMSNNRHVPTKPSNFNIHLDAH